MKVKPTVSAQANKGDRRPADVYSDWIRKLSRAQKDTEPFLSLCSGRCLRTPFYAAPHNPDAGRKLGPCASWTFRNLKHARQPEFLTADRRAAVPPLARPWFLAYVDPILTFLFPVAARTRCDGGISQPCAQHPSRRCTGFRRLAWIDQTQIASLSFLCWSRGARHHFAVSGQASAGDGLLVYIPGLGAAPRMMSDAQARVPRNPAPLAVSFSLLI